MTRAGALLGCLLLGGCLGSSTEPRQITIGETDQGDISAFSGRIDGLIAQSGRSYVTLKVEDPANSKTQEGNAPSDPITAASGFMIDNAGHVLTAAHVAVTKGWIVRATGPDGRRYKGRVVDTMPGMDTALIKLARPNGLQPVQPVADPCLSVGQPIYSLGKPKKENDTARLGSVVSMSFGRAVNYQGYGYSDAMVLRLQTRQGESGGPVFNDRGELVGMLVSTLSDSRGRPLNLAHAVTMPMLASFVCKNTNCSARWKSHVGRSMAQCRTPRREPQPVRG